MTDHPKEKDVEAIYFDGTFVLRVSGHSLDTIQSLAKSHNLSTSDLIERAVRQALWTFAEQSVNPTDT